MKNILLLEFYPTEHNNTHRVNLVVIIGQTVVSSYYYTELSRNFIHNVQMPQHSCLDMVQHSSESEIILRIPSYSGDTHLNRQEQVVLRSKSGSSQGQERIVSEKRANRLWGKSGLEQERVVESTDRLESEQTNPSLMRIDLAHACPKI